MVKLFTALCEGKEMNKLLAIILLLVTTVCFAEPEEMIKVYEEYDREKILNLFSSENIPYKVMNKNQIYYPVSYREKVKKIKEKIWGPVDDSKKGVSVKAKVAPALAAELVKKGVSFSVITAKDKSTFTWLKYYDQSAMEAVNDIVF